MFHSSNFVSNLISSFFIFMKEHIGIDNLVKLEVCIFLNDFFLICIILHSVKSKKHYIRCLCNPIFLNIFLLNLLIINTFLLFHKILNFILECFIPRFIQTVHRYIKHYRAKLLTFRWNIHILTPLNLLHEIYSLSKKVFINSVLALRSLNHRFYFLSLTH